MPHDLMTDVARGYCTEYGRQARDLCDDESWESVEPRLKQCWEHNHPHVTWEAARDQIEAEWWRHGAEY